MAALVAAEATLADAGATQGAIDAARTTLLGAAAALEIKAGYSAYRELIRLLVDIIALDGTLYTESSWDVLMDAALAAWDLVAAGAYANAAGLAPLGGGGKLEALATVPQDILDASRKLREAIAALQLKGSGPTPSLGKPMRVGVAAVDKPTCDLVMERLDEVGYGARFTVYAKDFENATMVHLSISYNEALFGAEIMISDFLLDNDCEVVFRYSRTDRPSVGFVEYTMMLQHKTPGAVIATPANADKEAELINIALKPKFAMQRVATVSLNHIDIAYIEPGVGTFDADVNIEQSFDSTMVRAFSIYDINRDGRVTLADVDIVRRNIGKSLVTHPAEWAADEQLRRCDLNGDYIIDYDDLLLIIVKYESTL